MKSKRNIVGVFNICFPPVSEPKFSNGETVHFSSAKTGADFCEHEPHVVDKFDQLENSPSKNTIVSQRFSLVEDPAGSSCNVCR